MALPENDTDADASAGGGAGAERARGGFFPATHWTEIAAIHGARPPEAEAALDGLCRTYLPAIEKYLRWFRNLPGDPRELANEFLGDFIHQDSLRRVDRGRGRFRSYLVGALKHFLRGRWRALARQPAAVEFDEEFMGSAADTGGAEAVFDRGFAEILVGTALAATRRRFAGSRIGSQLPDLLPYLGADPPVETLRELAARLGVSDDLLYQNLSRIRRELAEQLRAETRRHLGPEDDVEEEVQALLRAYACT